MVGAAHLLAGAHASEKVNLQPGSPSTRACFCPTVTKIIEIIRAADTKSGSCARHARDSQFSAVTIVGHREKGQWLTSTC